MSHAIRAALHEEMLRDKNVIVIGGDAGKKGSVFGITLGFKGLMKTAVRDDDPVVFIAHRQLLTVKGEMSGEDELIPLGKAIVKRAGTDVTIIAWSRQVLTALEAARELEKDGIDAEVLNLRSLVPLDWGAIKASVAKTHKVVIAQEGSRRSGYAGEISAQIMEEFFEELDAPVLRVAAPNGVVPFSPPLEDAFIPNAPDIVIAVKKLLNR
jgi:pyruvate/2-oxoglutarate/acetoin dehydrogenase E1 component